MDALRATYAVAKDTEFGRWLKRFWEGQPPPDDPLHSLLKPDDLRGEVTAWGAWPHWTALDAMTTSSPEQFAAAVKGVCQTCPSPVIEPQNLSIFARALVVECSSPASVRMRSALAAATRPLIARMPLADEEFQHAEWWIKHVGEGCDCNLEALYGAREEYRNAGSPPLPSSRHFRLGFLVRLWKERARASPQDREARDRHLMYFLTCGEPYWYDSPGGIHVTIASGLKKEDDADRSSQLRRLREALWSTVQNKLGVFRPAYLAIMGEDPGCHISVRFFDFLTETFVEEERPGLRIVDRADFAASGYRRGHIAEEPDISLRRSAMSDNGLRLGVVINLPYKGFDERLLDKAFKPLLELCRQRNADVVVVADSTNISRGLQKQVSDLLQKGKEDPRLDLVSCDTCDRWKWGFHELLKKEELQAFCLLPSDFQVLRPTQNDLKTMFREITKGDNDIVVGTIKTDPLGAKALIDTYATYAMMTVWFPEQASKLIHDAHITKPRSEFLGMLREPLETAMAEFWFPYSQTLAILLRHGIRGDLTKKILSVSVSVGKETGERGVNQAITQLERIERVLKFLWRDWRKETGRLDLKEYEVLSERSDAARKLALTVFEAFVK